MKYIQSGGGYCYKQYKNGKKVRISKKEYNKKNKQIGGIPTPRPKFKIGQKVLCKTDICFSKLKKNYKKDIQDTEMITMKTLELKIMDIITYNEDTKQVEDRGYNDVDKRKWESKCHYLSENEQKNCYIYKVRSIEDFALAPEYITEDHLQKYFLSSIENITNDNMGDLLNTRVPHYVSFSHGSECFNKIVMDDRVKKKFKKKIKEILNHMEELYKKTIQKLMIRNTASLNKPVNRRILEEIIELHFALVFYHYSPFVDDNPLEEYDLMTYDKRTIYLQHNPDKNIENLINQNNRERYINSLENEDDNIRSNFNRGNIKEILDNSYPIIIKTYIKDKIAEALLGSSLYSRVGNTDIHRDINSDIDTYPRQGNNFQLFSLKDVINELKKPKNSDFMDLFSNWYSDVKGINLNRRKYNKRINFARFDYMPTLTNISTNIPNDILTEFNNEMDRFKGEFITELLQMIRSSRAQQLRDIRLFPGQIVILKCDTGCLLMEYDKPDVINLKKSNTVGEFINENAGNVSKSEWCIYRGQVPNLSLQMAQNIGQIDYEQWGLWKLPLQYLGSRPIDPIMEPISVISNKWKTGLNSYRNPVELKTSLEKVIGQIRRFEGNRTPFILISSACRWAQCGIETDDLIDQGIIDGGKKKTKKVKKSKKTKKVKKSKKTKKVKKSKKI